MNPKSILACLLGAALGGTPAAQAALGVTNGNFETGGGNNIDNVTDWFDRNTGNFWEAAWQTNAASITPNGTNVVLFSSFGATSDPLVGSYLYQAIGTADGASSVKIGFDFGAPNDAVAGLSEGMTVAIYAFDGTGTFVPGDNVDLHAASQTAGSGVTLLSSNSSAQFVSTGVDGQISSYQATLDLSGAGTQQLFLSFNNYKPSTTECWPTLDNVVIISDTPIFSVQPTPHNGFVGSNVTLTATAVSDPPPTYQWQYSNGVNPWTDLGSETNSSLVIDPAEYTDNGFYRVVANNGTSITSDEVQVFLVYPAPVITAQPASVGALPGADIQLSVGATGLGNLSYQWFKADVGGDIALTGQTGTMLQLNDVSAANVGGYYVIVSDDAAVADEGFSTETVSATATVTLIDVLISASTNVPATDSFDEFYLPGNVDDVANIDGSPGGVPITASNLNDASTYAAFDRASQGMTFTTGSDPLGYTVSSVTVRNVQWTNYLNPGTYYNLQNGDTFEFQFGSVSGGVKTPLFDTNTAQYSGDALVNPGTPNNLGSGQYLTFNLSSAGIGTLAPNTTYYFEIATETGDAYFELSGTSANGYAAGTAFRGDTTATIDGAYVELTGDRAFHVDLTGLSGPAHDYAAWIGGYPGVGALAGFNDDADGDGLKNGLENYFGTDPATSNRGLTAVARSGNTITFQHPNANPSSDVSGAYIWSTDLTAYRGNGAVSGGTTVSFLASPDTPTAGTTTVTATITGTVPSKLFVALGATKNP
jgi:hypothetical protein